MHFCDSDFVKPINARSIHSMQTESVMKKNIPSKSPNVVNTSAWLRCVLAAAASGGGAGLRVKKMLMKMTSDLCHRWCQCCNVSPIIRTTQHTAGQEAVMAPHSFPATITLSRCGGNEEGVILLSAKQTYMS